MVKIKSMKNIPIIETSYYAVNDVEYVAFVDRGMFPYCDRFDFYDKDSKDVVKEITIDNIRYIIKNVIEEDKYFIFQLDRVD